MIQDLLNSESFLLITDFYREYEQPIFNFSRNYILYFTVTSTCGNIFKASRDQSEIERRELAWFVTMVVHVCLVKEGGG
jgi:hypothetical protein